MTPEPMEAVFCQLIGVIFSKAKDHVPQSADPYYYQYYSLSVQTAKFSPYGDAAKLAQPPNYH